MKNIIKFLPLLIIYVLVVLLASQDFLGGDEGDYLWFAQNLSKGYYTPHYYVNLWFGPGYPIVLLPFVSFKLPWLAARLMNPLFLFFAILYFYSTLSLYIHEQHAMLFSYLLGIYPPFFREIHLILTETMAIFLVCGFLYYFCRFHQNKKAPWLQCLTSSFFFGYLALTKIIYGYVLLSGLLLFLVLYLIKRKSMLKKTLFIYFFALLFCLPYLFYTHSLTGKIFYWGNSGGMSLYWMSSPFPNDLGDWFSPKQVREIPELSKNHQQFFNKIARLSLTQKDDEFKKYAIYNIIHNPLKFLKNWVANIGRLLFNYPYSYASQGLSTYFYFFPNMFLVVISILCLYPAWVGRKFIPAEIYLILLLGLISFGGSSLLSAFNRQFVPIVPIIALWISLTLVLLVKIQIRT